jgi:predicted ATPase/DNA-binding SARP family transcriptional activator
MHGNAVTAAPPLSFRILGPLEVEVNGVQLGKLPRRQRALLTRLLQDFGRPVTFDQLADAVWGGGILPTDAKGALYTLASRLRASLGGETFLLTNSWGYQTQAAQAQLDTLTFADLLHQARAVTKTDPTAALDLYGKALKLWRGPAFAEFADTFARPAAVALEEARFAAQLDSIGLTAGAGDAASAAAAAEQLVLANPGREQAWVAWMRTLAQASRPAEALEVYQRLRVKLAGELGTEPGHEAAELHRQILRGQIQPPAPAGRARYFPQPLGSFVGRAGELKLLTEAFASDRIITLTGPGGIGKTRLAVEFALSQLDLASTYWIDLAAVGDPASVPYAIGDALGVARAEGIAGVIATALSRRRLTLLVDNCEHLIDAVAGLLVPLAQRCPGLSVLATSREPLAIDGERVVPVGPLPLARPDGALADSDAAELLRQRLLSAMDPEAVREAFPAKALHEVCQRLDGMPLALELAAARMAALGTDSLTESMDLWQRAHGRRGRPDRHRDLDTLFGWSYDLLSGAGQGLLRQLSVFPGWFTRGQVSGLCPELAGELAALVAKSFVAQRFSEAEHGYRLLVPVREFAARRLSAAGEEREVRGRHAKLTVEWAVRACAALGTSAEPRAWEQLNASGPLLRSVQAWCRDSRQTELAIELSAALHHYAYMRDDHEMLGWAGQALELPGAQEHPLRPVLQASAAARLIQRGEWPRARRLIEDAVAFLAPGEARSVIPFTVLGDIDLYHGEFLAAIGHYRLAWQAALSHNDCWGQVEAAGSAAMACASHGLHDEASRWLDRCLDTLSHSAAPTQRAGTFYYLGECAGLRDPAAAEAHLMRSHELAVAIGANFLIGASMTRLTAFSTEFMPLSQSLTIFEKALRQWEATGNRAELWLTLFRLIPLLASNGETVTAAAIHAAVTGSGELPAYHLCDAPVDQRDRALRIEWAGADLPAVIALATTAIGRLRVHQA